MWVFLATEIMFFGGMFLAYTLYRSLYPWAFASASNHLDITLGAVNTGVLILSSFTMAMAVYFTQTGKPRPQVLCLVMTLLLGLTFLGIKAVEYHEKFVNHHVPGPSFQFEGPDSANAQLFFSLYFVLRNASSFIHYKCLDNVPLDKCASAAKVPVDNVDWLGLVRITEHATVGWGPLLIVVYVCSQLASSYFMSTTVDKTQRILLMVLPVVFVPFIIRFPAGLVLYWVTTNLWTVGQGLVTRRLIPKPAAPPKRSSRAPRKEAEAEAEPSKATNADGKAEDGKKAAPAAAEQKQPQSQSQGPPRRVRRKKKRSRR